MTRIEVLFPEFCSLFADSSNIRYLEKCLPDAEFVFTSYKRTAGFDLHGSHDRKCPGEDHQETDAL